MPMPDSRRIRELVARVAAPTGAGEFVRRQRVSRLINEHCRVGARVVDLGAGAGNLVAALRADLRDRYIVVDIGPGVHGQRVMGDVTTIPLREASADCVCLSDVLEHIERDLEAVEEAVRIVRPGGHVVIHVPSMRPKPYRALQRAADAAELADHQQFPHVRDGYTDVTLRDMLGRVAGSALVTLEPSFGSAQSLMSDLDALLWWRKWTALRVGTWVGIRILSLSKRPPHPSTSSGYVAVLQRSGASPLPHQGNRPRIMSRVVRPSRAHMRQQ